MIPTAFLQAWSVKAPWPDLRQIEQDLIICRALCDLLNVPALMGKLAFRGGTAIHKLLFRQPLRYSEDIELVQTQPEPIGRTVDAVRDALSWRGKCNREQAGHSLHLVFRFTPRGRRTGNQLIARIDGEPWKLADSVIEELRAVRYPDLLMPRKRKPRQRQIR